MFYVFDIVLLFLHGLFYAFVRVIEHLSNLWMFSMKIINTLLKQVKSVLLVLSIALFSISSYGGNTLVETFVSGNDCDGDSPFAGQGFANCTINIGGTELAFVLTKFDGNLGHDEDGINYTYDADHWDIDGAQSGTWSTPTGVGYPEVSFWAAKGGNGFNLFWFVTVDDYSNECDPDELTIGCMSAAVSVTTGTWSTPSNNGGQQAGLSHLTFFGGVCTENCGSTEVPEPATIIILALALALLRLQAKPRNT